MPEKCFIAPDNVLIFSFSVFDKVCSFARCFDILFERVEFANFNDFSIVKKNFPSATLSLPSLVLYKSQINILVKS